VRGGPAATRRPQRAQSDGFADAEAQSDGFADAEAQSYGFADAEERPSLGYQRQWLSECRVERDRAVIVVRAVTRVHHYVTISDTEDVHLPVE
jgi:hypothetical protein